MMGADRTRRDFLTTTPKVLAGCLLASALDLRGASAAPMSWIEAHQQDGPLLTYDFPTEDGVNIDRKNAIIIVREDAHIYAFSLACPHENTALRWRKRDHRFQCPLHDSRYQPDGTFIDGRATRNMDRFAVRLDGERLVVDTDHLYRSDEQADAWAAAQITK